MTRPFVQTRKRSLHWFEVLIPLPHTATDLKAGITRMREELERRGMDATHDDAFEVVTEDEHLVLRTIVDAGSS